MQEYYLNISDKYKFFTWTAQRTGSTHFTDILNRLGFQSAYFKDGKLVKYKNTVWHNHFCKFFENHWDYSFLISIRNPYSMIISQTGAAKMQFSLENQKIIQARIENLMQNPLDVGGCCQCFHIRKPDYAVRLENLYEDWVRIPFVKTHNLYLSGTLKELCKRKLNGFDIEDQNYWKKYYNQSLADLVYYNHPETFELYGYDRESWRQ